MVQKIQRETTKIKRLLSPRKLKAVDEYINSYLKICPNRVERVILFGSQARGRGRPDSDIDLLIITNTGEKAIKPLSPLWQFAIKLALDIDHKYNYQIGISPKLVNRNYFNRWSPFIENVRREGVSLWSKKK